MQNEHVKPTGAESAADNDLLEVWTRIDDATASKGPVSKPILENAIALLKSLLSAHSSAARWYTLGYALYIHPDRISSELIQGQTQEAFRRALALEPCFGHAWLYLGHHYYDLGLNHDALQSFEKAATCPLPKYLALKLLEMKLCCEIARSGLTKAVPLVQEFVDDAEGHPVQDIAPFELAKVLRERLPEADEVTREALEPLLSKLDRVGHFRGWFADMPRSRDGCAPG